MQKFSRRMALLTGGLCLGVSLLLVLVSHLSSRHILEQQRDAQYRALVGQLARQLAPLVAQNDLIRLEATLRRLLGDHDLQIILVTDLEARPLGQAGEPLTPDSVSFSAPLTIDGNLAGEVVLAGRDDNALLEHRRMSTGLLLLALLASAFVAALAGRWGQEIGQRLSAATGRLARDVDPTTNEVTALEQAIAALPLEILLPAAPGEAQEVDFEEAGLVFVHLRSLIRYVETLDEQSLLNYTDSLRRLFLAVAALYGGQLSVSREFGVLLTFSAGHGAGSPAFRAVSAAWLLQRLAQTLGTERSLKYRLSLACGLGEAARSRESHGCISSLYPDLYNQHIIDDLATAAVDAGDAVALSKPVADDHDVKDRCRADPEGEHYLLRRIEEPFADLLNRQYRVLIREFENRA